MSRIKVTQKVPRVYDPQVWEDIVRSLQDQLNAISENRIEAKYNSRSAAPTMGSFARGDFIPNTNTLEQGTAGGKYVLSGWVCTTAPLTFKECRFLTGS